MRVLLALALSTLLLASCSAEEGATGEVSTSTERSENVRVLDLQRSDLDEWLSVTGRLRAIRATDVSTEESGVVDEIYADRGRQVTTGEILVRLDRRMLDAEWKSAEAAAILRRYNEERTRTLFDEDSVSKQEMLRVHTELEQAEQYAEIARLRYERAAIAAPFDGVVVDRYVELGELVGPGQRVVRVVDSSVLKLEAYATEVEVAHLELGAPALLAVTGVETPAWAELSWVSIEASPSSGKFGLEIRVVNSDSIFRAGVLATARVLKQRHDRVLAIPRDAVTRSSRGPRVFVVEGSRARARAVELGADQGVMVIVTAGLEGGEELIVRGQRDVADGALVAVTERSERRDGSMDGDPPQVREEGSLRAFGDRVGDTDLQASGSGSQ